MTGVTTTRFSEAVDVRSNSVHELVLPNLFAVDACLHQRSPTAHIALVRSTLIILDQPRI